MRSWARTAVLAAMTAGCGTPPKAVDPPKPHALPGHQPSTGGHDGLLPEGFPAGCFAWSPHEPAAVCVIGNESDQAGGVWSVAFISDVGGRYRIAAWGGLGAKPPRALTLKDRQEVESRIVDGKYQNVPEFKQIDPESSPMLVGALSVRVIRTEEQHVKWSTGEWDVVVDRIEARCPNRKNWLTLREVRVEGPIQSLVTAGSLDARRVLVFHQVKWGIVGDKGASAVAVLVDLEPCRAWTSEV